MVPLVYAIAIDLLAIPTTMVGIEYQRVRVETKGILINS
jgi:hypothetical protein